MLGLGFRVWGLGILTHGFRILVGLGLGLKFWAIEGPETLKPNEHKRGGRSITGFRVQGLGDPHICPAPLRLTPLSEDLSSK